VLRTGQSYNIGTGDTREHLTSCFEDAISQKIYMFKEI